MNDKLKILFATDFSPGSKVALKTLKLLQKKYKIEVSMIHVVKSFWKNWITSGLYKKESMQRMEVWQKKISTSSGTKNLTIEIGNPAEIIIEFSQKRKLNLILMGGKVTGESVRYKTGTAVESVVRSATKPVWICQRNKISKILCGVDGSPSSGKALKFAIDLARKYSAQLCIIHALPNYLPAFGMSDKSIRKEEEKFKIESTNHIQKFINSFTLKKIKFKTIIDWGDPSTILLDHAEDYNYDLIVISAKGQNLLRHVLLGSTAEKILRYAPCSLLVVK